MKTIPYRPHPAQKEFHQSKARFRTLICGRRWGKSLAAANEAIMAGLRKPNAHIWLVAPSYPLTQTLWRTVVKYMPREAVLHMHNAQKSIELKNGTYIEARSADNPLSLVSVGLDLVIIDEAARVDGRVAWYQSLSPALGDKQGRAIFITTPLAFNWVYDIYMLGLSGVDPDWQSFRFPTSTNPFFPAIELEKQKQLLPDRIYRQEFLAEFISDSGAVFNNIEACVKGSLEAPQQYHNYILSVDVARYEDFTVLGVMDTANGHVVAFERFGKLDFNSQKIRITNLAAKYHAKTYIDSTAMGLPILEDLRHTGLNVEGITIQTLSKANLIDALSLALEQEKISYPKIDVLVEELRAFEYQTSPTGHLKSGAPKGKHDDCVIMLAMLVYGLNRSNMRVKTFNYYSG